MYYLVHNPIQRTNERLTRRQRDQSEREFLAEHGGRGPRTVYRLTRLLDPTDWTAR